MRTMMSPWHFIAIGAFSLALFGCTLTQTAKDILSSTTPGDWFTVDGLPKAEHKVDIFVAVNLENVKADVARGEGEYLAALSPLLKIPVEYETEFFALAQQRYRFLADKDQLWVSQTLIALAQGLKARDESQTLD
jgi:Protein of unknown function (DUF3015)